MGLFTNQYFMIALNSATIINLIVLSIVLLLKKNKSRSNTLFIASLLFVNLYFVSNVLVLTKLAINLPILFFIANSLVVFYTVFIYLFSLAVLEEKKPSIFLLSLSALIFAITLYNAVNFYALDEHNKLLFFENLSDVKKFPIGVMLQHVGYFWVQMTYYLVVFFKIKKIFQNYNNSNFES